MTDYPAGLSLEKAVATVSVTTATAAISPTGNSGTVEDVVVVDGELRNSRILELKVSATQMLLAASAAIP